jgi:hypothetical protein
VKKSTTPAPNSITAITLTGLPPSS